MQELQEKWVQSLGWKDPMHLENSTDRGDWRATVHGVTKCQRTGTSLVVQWLRLCTFPVQRAQVRSLVGELDSTCHNWDQVQPNKQLNKKKKARWLSNWKHLIKTPLQERKSNNSEGGKIYHKYTSRLVTRIYKEFLQTSKKDNPIKNRQKKSEQARHKRRYSNR